MHYFIHAFQTGAKRQKSSDSRGLGLANRDAHKKLMANLDKFEFGLSVNELSSYYQKIQSYTKGEMAAVDGKLHKKSTGLRYSIHPIEGRYFICRELPGPENEKKERGRRIDIAIDLLTGDPFIATELRRKVLEAWVNSEKEKVSWLPSYDALAAQYDRMDAILLDNLARKQQNAQILDPSAEVYRVKRREGDKHYLFLPYVEGEDLFELFSQQKISNSDTLSVLKDAIKLLKKLHAKNLIWGDFALENIVYSTQSKQTSLIDFESMRHVKEAQNIPDFWGIVHHAHEGWYQEGLETGSFSYTFKNDHYSVLSNILLVMSEISKEIESEDFHEYYSAFTDKYAPYAVRPIEECPDLDALSSLIDELQSELKKHVATPEFRLRSFCCCF